MTEQTCSPAEIVRRGKEWYERSIRAEVEEGNRGKTLVIDVESGDYEMDEDAITAAHRLRERRPGSLFYLMRVGYPAFAKIGGGWRMGTR